MQLSDYDVRMLRLLHDPERESEDYTEEEMNQLDAWHKDFTERLFG